ncbi:MAG: AlpA family phage regulatory protein [Proteobacteria bacterium]|nr:AlpA family phage regulatory protein [Pseudomonadota bacterium]
MKNLVKILNLSRASIYRLRKNGDFIPHIQLSSRCVGYEDGALMKWLEERAKNIEEK